MKARKEMVRMGTKIGGVLGGMAFLVFGIIPGFYFGSYGTLVLMNHLLGEALQATVLVRAAAAAGALVGVVCIGSVSIVVGAIFGTAVGYATEALTSGAREKLTAADALAQTKAK